MEEQGVQRSCNLPRVTTATQEKFDAPLQHSFSSQMHQDQNVAFSSLYRYGGPRLHIQLLVSYKHGHENMGPNFKMHSASCQG